MQPKQNRTWQVLMTLLAIGIPIGHQRLYGNIPGHSDGYTDPCC